MKTLDRYVLLEFVLSFVGILSVFALIILLNQVLGTLSAVKVENPNLYQITLYFLNSLPGQLMKVTPISVILAVMFGVGTLAKRKELLAMHASGISYVRIAVPLVIAMFVISATVLVLGQVFVPDCEQRARIIERVSIKGKDQTHLTKNRNVTTRGKHNLFYDMKSFDSRTKIMERPIITQVSDNGHVIKLRIDAETAQMVSHGPTTATVAQASTADDGEEQPRYWHFHNAIRWTFDDSGNMVNREDFDDLELPMEEDLDRFLSTNKKTQEMGYSDLRQAAAIQGERVRGAYFYGIETEMYNRLAFPFAALLLGLVGYTFAVRSSIRSFVLEFGLALVYTGVYYVLMIFGQRAGDTGFVQPIVAAWYTNAVFLVIVVWRFRELQRVPNC